MEPSRNNEQQSFLEQLIEQSTLEQRGDYFSASALWNDTVVGSWDQNTLPSASLQPQMPLLSTTDADSNAEPKASLLTLAATTCCLLQVGFTWASFLSPSWLDTRFFADVGVPSIRIKPNQGQLLHSASLGSMFGDILGAGQHWAAIAFVLTSLVLPCLCIITGAAWIAEDRKERIRILRAIDISKNNNAISFRRRLRRYNSGQNCWSSPRLFVEYIARIGVSVLFVIYIMEIGTSPLTIEFMGSELIVVNQIKGGMAAYTLGMICSLFVIVLLRLDKTTIYGIHEPMCCEQNEQYNVEKTRSNLEFEWSWDVQSNALFSALRGTNATTKQRKASNDEREELSSPLLQNESCTGDHAEVDRRTWTSIIDGAAEETDDRTAERHSLKAGVLPFWKRFFLYELGVLSTVLWLPALFVPLFQLDYGGFASEFMPEVSMSIRLVDIPVELWECGTAAGTSRFILVVVEILFLSFVFLGPMVANLLAIGAWICDSPFRISCKNVLWILQPCLGSIVFVAAVFVSVPAFAIVMEYAIDKFASPVCDSLKYYTSDNCFTIHAEPSMGLWFLLGKALALEIFVLFTLSIETQRYR